MGVFGRSRKSQKESQDDQGVVQGPLGLEGAPGPPGLSSGSSLTVLGLRETFSRKNLIKTIREGGKKEGTRQVQDGSRGD